MIVLVHFSLISQMSHAFFFQLKDSWKELLVHMVCFRDLFIKRLFESIYNSVSYSELTNATSIGRGSSDEKKLPEFGKLDQSSSACLHVTVYTK